jgi:hypothetical protein
MTVFETETMAELCVKQGLVTEALAIYRRLVADAHDDTTRARRARRLAELERIAKGVAEAREAISAPPVAAPGGPALTVERRHDTLHLAWSLPPETAHPALQLLLLRRGPDGIEPETRTLPLDSTRGTTTLDARGLYSLRAAAGWLDGPRFVPLARLTSEAP